MESAADRTLEEVLEAWNTNDRINKILLDAIPDEAMGCTLSTRGGRNVARQFAHLHNVRYWQLENRARDLVEGLHKFESADVPSRDFLKQCLDASNQRIATFFKDVAAGVPKRRGFKKGLVVHLAYFVSHESHHRGNILLTLKQSGHSLDQKTRYAIWNWDRI